MSSAMQNFMGAYAAVHNSEAKEEYYSVRDVVSEMNTGVLTDNDLREIAEEVCETLFSEEMKLNEVENILTEVLEEGQNVGRNRKTSRLFAAFVETFDRIKSKANRLESFAKYRESKKLQETWSARFNQDKRVQRHHSALVAKECANVKSGLLELYKGKHGQTEKQYQDSRSDAGKMVSGDSKMSGSKYAQGRRTSSDAGPQPAGGSMKPQSQGKMDSGSRTDLQFRKAALKKKSMRESWADAYTAIYEKKADKDYDGDGKIESGTDEYMGSKDKAIKKAMGKKGVKEDACAHNAKGEDCPKHGKETDCTMKEGVRDINPEKGTAERKARLEKKRGMKMDDHPQYKKESVQFSETELEKFKEIVNSWSD
tara:strand:- start:2410 stop:3516 length:1107 start_codon:yes stop_codon:yes gene_type:complete